MSRKNMAAMGLRIRQRRTELNLTQEDLAERAGVSVSFIGHIERGEKAASVDTVVELCKVLELSLDYVILGKKELRDRDYGLFDDLCALVDKYTHL